MIPTPGNCAGNIPLLKKSLNAFVALGHKAKSSDFEFVMRGFEGIKTLVQAVQIPVVGREPIELFAPYGVKFQQQGSPNTSGEMPITFLETVHGDVYKRLRESSMRRCYWDATLTLNCEELPSGVAPLKFNIYNCWIKLDGVDLSTEDQSAVIKPAGTLYYNWFDYDA